MKPEMVACWSNVNQDRFGDEFQTWHVAVANLDGEPMGKIYNCSSRQIANNLGEKMSKDRKLEQVWF